ncbi:unnamed protein product [Calypogeia fissa]
MSTGVGRPGTGRRGMTVLGKVPKPVNLPSQRLENRGLDPNVEIVPRGSVSWGSAGSPPTSASPWGNSAQSSPPVSSGAWAGAPPRPSTAGSVGSGTASVPGTISTGAPWGGHPPRPSSAGSGTRPSSAGSLRQPQETVAAANAWGPATARPSSASGVLGQAQPQSPPVRPRSAETRAQAPALTRFAEQTNGPASPAPAAWGGAGGARKLGEEPHQPARFTLTRVDFPTLGSEKNPDLRPQQNKTAGSPGDRPASADERVPPAEERPPSGPPGPYDEPRPASPGAYGGQERMPEGWRREGRPYGGHPGMADANWHREGPAPMQPYGGGQPPVADTWRREPGHGAAPGGGPSDDNWRRGGPPVGPYGPPGPGRFQHDPAFMHQQRYGPGPGPGPYGRSGGPGPGGYGRHGDMYGNTAPFGRPGGAPPRPGPPMGPGMYQGPGPYENYYGPPGPGYGNMDEREMMMLGMNGPPGIYGNYPQGPPVEPYGRYPHGGPGPGHRHMPNNMGINRERNEGMGYEGEGFRDGPKYKENANFKDGGGYNKETGLHKDGGRPNSYQDPGESRRAGHVMSSNLTSDMQRPSSRGGHQGNHRDWGAAASSDEPMDFSKPVFEEDVSSASPGPGNKSVQSEPGVDSGTVQTSESENVDHLKLEDSPELPAGNAVDGGEAKDAVVMQARSSGTSEGDLVQTRKVKEVESGGPVSKTRLEDVSPLETKDQLAKKVQVSEGSESSEKRWGKAQTRERSFGREPISSAHTGKAVGSRKEPNQVTSVVVPSASASLRPGVHSSGSSKSRPTTPSVTQGSIPSTPETLASEEVVFPPVQEKHMQSSDASSPSGSDGQKGNDKVRILKRVGESGPESPHSDTVNITESSLTEVSVSSIAAEALVKDDTKPKGKTLINHDGEKEWRPKVVPVADITTEVPRPSSAANSKQSTSGVPSSEGAAGSTEKADSENLSNAESYDYEAQRARMKEIAAQRAIQLRKEEDERIKEQKAKALAKLEELNRRSLVASVSKPEEPAVDEPTEEPAPVIVQTEETEVVISEVVTEEVQVLETSITGTVASTTRVRNDRNEHGKRERAGDRKSNGRSREEHRAKMGPGEHRELTKARTTAMSSSQVKTELSLVSPESQQATTAQASILSPSIGHVNPVQPDSGVPLSEISGSLGSQVLQQGPLKAQEGRHRGRQSASQLKQAARQPPPSVEPDHPAPGPVILSESNDNVGGWPVGTSALLDLDPKEVTLSLGSNVVSTEGATAARKKKPKSSGRNRQKVEGLTVSTDSTSFVDSNQGWNDSNDSGTEVGKPTPKAVTVSGGDDVAKTVPSSFSQKDLVLQDLKSESSASELPSPVEIAGSDGGSLRSNGEILSRRTQRKSQLARERRVPARERGTSQDVRVGDKSHGGEGMIWAPVRSPSGAHPAGPKGGFGSDFIASADTAVEKKEESAVAPQTGRARRAELERYTPKPVVKQQAQQQEEMQQQHQAPMVPQNQVNDSANVPVTNEVPQNSTSVSEIKFGSEARQAETSSKQSRSHASWRQRGSGSERLSAHKETNQVQHSESVDTGGKFQQPSHNNQTQQNYHRGRPQSATSEQSRPGSSHQTREGGRIHSSTSVAEKEQQNLEGPQQGRTSHSNLPAPAPAVTERDSKAPQEGVTPYQPPRPGSSQTNRGLEGDVQSSHEHVRSHRINVSQDSRQHAAPGKFDRDHHGPQERGQGHQHSRSQSFRHDRDQSQAHSGSNQQPRSAPPVQPSAPEGASTNREQGSLAAGAAQGRPAPQSLHEKHPSTDREQRPADRVGAHQQPRSPPRQRVRQHAVAHEREQAPASHGHQPSRYRQAGQEKDHHRDVPNAVHHQQHQRGTSDGQWQQTGVPSTDLGNEHTTRSTSHKSQVDKDHPPALSSSQQHAARSDPQNKPQGPAPIDSQKQPQYQPVSQHQRPQQPVSQGPKVDNAHNSSQWNGERSGSPPAFRGREHGHSRRGRFGGRYSGAGRGGDIEHRREQLSKQQRLPIDAASGAVPSQVGG